MTVARKQLPEVAAAVCRGDVKRLDLVGEQVGRAGCAFQAAEDDERGLVQDGAALPFPQPGRQITFTMPVSSSRLRKTTPPAVGGRCRWAARSAGVRRAERLECRFGVGGVQVDAAYRDLVTSHV